MSGLRSDERRVVVTGVGLISPSGHNLETFWLNVVQGKSAAAKITGFDAEHLPTKIAAEVKDFDVSAFTNYPKAKHYDRSVQFSLAAASNAYRDAGLTPENVDPARVGVIEGSTINAMESMLKANASLQTSYKKIHPYNVVGGYFGEGSSAISIALKLRGHSMTYCSGCSSGADAMGYARQIIADDEADVMLAGGTEGITELLHSGFCKLQTMTERDGNPHEAMRSFDRDRDGFLLGEGAAYVVLEELSHAKARGRKIYAELVSHGRVSEAYHATNPHPEGRGYQLAILQALKKARAPREKIQYINAHASATPLNDPTETLAISSVFGSHAKKLQIGASKQIFGHLMGAAGAMEGAVTVLSIFHSELPPTINLFARDPKCTLDYVETRRAFPVEEALCVNAGFGGRYSCLYFRKC